MDEFIIRTLTPETPWTFTFEDFFDDDEEFIKQEASKHLNPTSYLNQKIREYVIERWSVEELLNVMEDYIQFVPISDDLNIPTIPEKFY